MQDRTFGKNLSRNCPFHRRILYCTGSPTQTISAARCLMRPWDQLSLRVYCTLHIQPYFYQTQQSKIRKLRKIAPRHKILTGGTTEAESRRELVQHGVLSSLAGGECPGSRVLHCDGQSGPPAPTDRSECSCKGCSAASSAYPTKPTDPGYFTYPKE
jgi:hypothetical protein